MSLPVRIKANVRDVWNKEDSEVQRTILAVKKLIGLEVLVEPEWALLWTTLSKHFPDPASFVPSVASIFTSWCKSLIDIAEDESNEAWTETLLEKLKGARGGLRILIEVSDGRPSTHWDERNMAFEICFPKSVPPRQHTMIAGFHTDLIKAFVPPPKEPSLPVRGGASRDNDETFTEIDASDFGDSASIMTPSATTGRFPSGRPAVLDSLPDIKTLERPEDLMKFPPYHMILRHSSVKGIDIQCSHEPSLNLIAEYFKRWVKRNHNNTNKPPAASIIMRESCFGLGLLYDRLEFEVDSYDHKHGLSPTLMLTFIEGVLGYRMTYNDSSSWTFRRDTAFKS